MGDREKERQKWIEDDRVGQAVLNALGEGWTRDHGVVWLVSELYRQDITLQPRECIDKMVATQMENQRLESRLADAANLLRGCQEMLHAWENGVCPEGVELGTECPRCSSPCDVYSELDGDVSAWLKGGE